MAYPLLRHSIGNGKSTLFWHNNWCNESPLYKEGQTSYGIPIAATIAEVYSNTQWFHNFSRDGRMQKIQNELAEVTLLPDREDSVVWVANRPVSFTVSSTWAALKRKEPESHGTILSGSTPAYLGTASSVG